MEFLSLSCVLDPKQGVTQRRFACFGKTSRWKKSLNPPNKTWSSQFLHKSPTYFSQLIDDTSSLTNTSHLLHTCYTTEGEIKAEEGINKKQEAKIKNVTKVWNK